MPLLASLASRRSLGSLASRRNLLGSLASRRTLGRHVLFIVPPPLIRALGIVPPPIASAKFCLRLETRHQNCPAQRWLRPLAGQSASLLAVLCQGDETRFHGDPDEEMLSTTVVVGPVTCCGSRTTKGRSGRASINRRSSFWTSQVNEVNKII